MTDPAVLRRCVTVTGVIVVTVIVPLDVEFAGHNENAPTAGSHLAFRRSFAHPGRLSFTNLIRKNVTGTGFEVCEGRH